MKKLRLLAIALVVAGFFGATTVAYGGLTWSGIDPVLKVGNHDVNIIVYIPAEICEQGDVEAMNVRVDVPKGLHATLLSESEGCGTATETVLRRSKGKNLKVRFAAESDEDFTVKVGIIIDGGHEKICRGKRGALVATCSVKLK